jgi:hypothetical protein
MRVIGQTRAILMVRHGVAMTGVIIMAGSRGSQGKMFAMVFVMLRVTGRGSTRITGIVPRRKSMATETE